MTKTESVDLGHKLREYVGGEVEITTCDGAKFRGRIDKIELRDKVVIKVIFLFLVGSKDHGWDERSLRTNYTMEFELSSRIAYNKFEPGGELTLVTVTSEVIIFYPKEMNILSDFLTQKIAQNK